MTKTIFRSLLTFILALAFFVSQASAGFLLNPFVFGSNPTLTFLQCATDPTDTNTYTFSAQNTGTESSNRTTIIGVAGRDSATVFDVSSVTVGGDAATERVDQGGSNNLNAAIYVISNTVGTSEDVVESIIGAAICLWDAKALNATTAVDTAADSGDELILDVNTSLNGIVVAIGGGSDAGDTIDWTGLTEQADAGGDLRYTAADASLTAAATPRSINVDGVGVGDAITGAAASFR